MANTHCCVGACVVQQFLQPDVFISTILEAEQTSIATSIIDAVEEGKLDALKALAGLKKLEAITNAATERDEKKNPIAAKAEQLQNYVLETAATYGQKKFDAFGATFNQTEVGTKYDWSKCNDPKLIELQAAAEKAAKELKERKEMLKNLPAAGITVTDEETGETSTIYPPAKSSTSTVSVSFK